MKKIAIVGLGFMGRMHYGCWKKLRGAKVSAICDTDLARLEKSSGGNIAGADQATDYDDAKIYDDFDLVNFEGVGFLYYLNPTPNDRNLEWDMRNNLCPNPGKQLIPGQPAGNMMSSSA